MVHSPQVRHIRRAKKEAQLFREITDLLQTTARDDVRLQEVFVSRVELSPEGGMCTVYFYTAQGEEHFITILETLKLYKPSLRRALAQRLTSRYTPDLLFKFDSTFDKKQRLENIFENIKSS